MMLPDTRPDLVGRFNNLRAKNADRDNHMREVALARSGEIHQVMPGIFPRNWSKPIIANVLDTTARELAETLSRLPQIDCQTSKNTSDRSKKYASKKTKIALYYVDKSRLKHQLYSGGDWYMSYGAMPIVVEPDMEEQCPHLRVDTPVGAYWELDLYGCTKTYAKCWYETVGSLKAKFPELADKIAYKDSPSGTFAQQPDDSMLEVVKWYGKDQIYTFLPERKGIVLLTAPNPLGKVPVVIAERPRWDEQTRGAFDDVMWVWLARARMAVYGLEAADKAIRAPIAVPHDVNRITFGPDAIIRANDPNQIKRVNLEMPQSALIEAGLLDTELQKGTRMPAIRQDIPSIATGPAVESLSNTFTTQISTAQDIIGDALRRAISMAFEFDEKVWGNMTKEIRGQANGAPFAESYRPSSDIRGDYSCSVTYGFIAGMDPNRALVFLLQMRADQAIDRNTMQRQLPFDIDVEQLQRNVDTEMIQDALKQGVLAYMAQAPMIAAQGGPDPRIALQQAAKVIELREKGKPIHEAILEAFEIGAQPQPGMAEMMGQALNAPPEATGLPPGEGGESGLTPEQEVMQGRANQADMAYSERGLGGSPDLQMLLAGLTSSGKPNLQAYVSKRLPA